MTKQNTLMEYIVSTSHQKVLRFLCENNDREYYDAEIALKIKDLSKASTNNALKDLFSLGIINRRYLGNIALNSIDTNSPLLKQYKILLSVLKLSGLVAKIKEDAEKIIIFGNSALGENKIGEAVDLFIVTENVSKIERIIENDPIFPDLHLIIHTPKQVESFRNEAPLFFENIIKGIRLI